MRKIKTSGIEDQALDYAYKLINNELQRSHIAQTLSPELVAAVDKKVAWVIDQYERMAWAIYSGSHKYEDIMARASDPRMKKLVDNAVKHLVENSGKMR